MHNKYKDSITPEQLKAALYINGDQNVLLEKVSKGDKAALVQLVLYWMPYIISEVCKEKFKGSVRTELIDAALNEGVVKLIDEHAAQVKKTGKVKRNWQDNMFKYINIAIENVLDQTNYRQSRAKYDAPERISFLNRINRLLKKAEREIVDRGTDGCETGEEKFKNKDPFTVDYMVEAQVGYFLRKNDFEVHTYTQRFNYKDTIVENDYGLLLSEEDWYESGAIWPELAEPYCYLMHDLLFHSRIYEKVFELDMIWIDIIYTDQKGMGIRKDGNSTRLKVYNLIKDKDILHRG